MWQYVEARRALTASTSVLLTLYGRTPAPATSDLITNGCYLSCRTADTIIKTSAAHMTVLFGHQVTAALGVSPFCLLNSTTKGCQETQ